MRVGATVSGRGWTARLMRRWPSQGLRDLFSIDQGDNLLARAQLLHRKFAIRRADHRAAHVADSAEEDVGASGTVRLGEHMPGRGGISDGGQVKGVTIGKRDDAGVTCASLPHVTVTPGMLQRAWPGSAADGKQERTGDETSARQFEDAAGGVSAGCDYPHGTGRASRGDCGAD